ncbi:MAG: hypothetical protein ABSH04_00465, partial [Acidimicrobiales bacterium]
MGKETAVDQVLDNATDGDGARVDSTTGDAPNLDITGTDTGREDAVNTTLATVLASHPEAVFYAIDANAHTVDMPDSVDLNGHDVIEGRNTALDMV